MKPTSSISCSKRTHTWDFDKDGKVNKGEYMFVKFDPGYDADESDPEDIVEEGDW